MFLNNVVTLNEVDHGIYLEFNKIHKYVEGFIWKIWAQLEWIMCEWFMILKLIDVLWHL